MFGLGTKAQLVAIQEENNKLAERFTALSTVFDRADIRLDLYGPTLVESFGDTVTEHSSGRWTSTTVVGDIYVLTVTNTPGREQLTYMPIKHVQTVPQLVVKLTPKSNNDFTDADMRRIEKWIDFAKTGQEPDPNRHADRLATVGALIG